jgi:hypothetical protein
MKKERSKLVKALDAAALIYLALWAFDYLISRAWGAFLIVTALATVTWALPLTYVDYFFLGGEDNGEHLGAIWITALIFGAATAHGMIYGTRPVKRGGKMQSFRLWRSPKRK